MVLHFNYHKGVGPNILGNDVLVFDAHDDAGGLIARGKWITSHEVSRQTGFSQELSSYTKDGRIRYVWVDGRRYFFQEDVDRELKVPEGWWSEEAVVKYCGNHPDYLRRLKRGGELVGKTVHKVPYYEPSSVKEYFDTPKGTFTREEANDFLEVSGKKTLQRLVRERIVGVQERNGRNHYSQADLWRYVDVPDNCVSIRFTARKSDHSELEVFVYAIENGLERKERKGATYIQMIPESDWENMPNLAPGDAAGKIEAILRKVYDEFVFKYDSTLEIASAIAGKLKVPVNGFGSNGANGNGQKDGHSDGRYGIAVTFNTICQLVESLK